MADSKARAIAQRGIRTADEARTFLAALMADTATGAVPSRVSNKASALVNRAQIKPGAALTDQAADELCSELLAVFGEIE